MSDVPAAPAPVPAPPAPGPLLTIEQVVEHVSTAVKADFKAMVVRFGVRAIFFVLGAATMIVAFRVF